MTTGWYRSVFFSRKLLCEKKQRNWQPQRQVGLKLAPIHGTVHWSQLTPLLLEVLMDTPQKINMEPETDGLEDDFPFQTGDFQVPC